MSDSKLRIDERRTLKVLVDLAGLFSVAKLHTAFEIFNDEAMAVRSFDLRPR